MSTSPMQVPPSPRPMDFNSRAMRWNSARRNAMNYVVAGLSILATIIVLAPLAAILFYLVYKGASSLNLAFFTHIPAPVGQSGGGMSNAIVGSAIILVLASLMGIPIGIAAGVYLAEFGRGKVMANAVRFTADVLNGVPSIVMGIAIYSLVVMPQK
ncbi:MAG TPA: phosphate ABC transporter permease PtsA, partial [Edaphobacter sp.]|nr:phosphate ABC transporter permease PtsA [Edaphobacter sp.]